MQMKKFNNKIYRDLRAIGIPEYYQGERFLYAALQIVQNDPMSLCSITKQVYPDIAKIYHTSASCVERNMRTFVACLWEERDYLNRVAGKPLTKRPTNRELISLMAAYLDEEEINVF